MGCQMLRNPLFSLSLSPPIKTKQWYPYFLEALFGEGGPNETVLSSTVTKLGDMSKQPLGL